MRSLPRRRLVAIALSAAFLAALLPALVFAFSVGTPSVDSDRAKSSQDSNADGTIDLKCPSRSYAYGMAAENTTWGTYPSVTYITVYCRDASGTTSSRTFGDAVCCNQIIAYTCGASSGPGAMSGLKVGHDRYIKDFQLRCGVIAESSSSVRVTSNAYNGKWYFNKVQNNDTQTNLVCDPTNSVSDKVVTGLRLRYKHDNNEYAVTSVQVICARLT